MTKRNRRRTRNKRLDFQKLEPRQLLAGDLAGPHQGEYSAPVDSNLVANGDFESITAGSDNFYTESEVTGWLAKDAASGQEINIINYQGYDNVLDLDSTAFHFDRVYQNIETEANTDYLITFDFRSHTFNDPDATADTHGFQVWFDGQLVGQFSGADQWQTGTIAVNSGSGGTVELLFCEIEEGQFNAGDTRGPLLDNIRLMKAHATDGVIANAGFETTDSERTTFFRPQDVEGWGAFGSDVDKRFLKIINNANAANQSSEGSQYLNLDSQADVQDGVFQDLATTEGSTYLVTFDYRTDGTQDSADPETRDEFRVRWGGDWAGTFQSEGDWRSVGLILTADSDTTRLTFLEPGEANGGDGSGALIDNIKITEVRSNTVELDLNGNESGSDVTSNYVPGLGSQSIATATTIQDVAGVNISRATITLENELDGTDELLGVAASSIPNDGEGNPLITVADYDHENNQLVLTGDTSAENYQTVLRTLSYFNNASSFDNTDRNITVTVEDSNANASSANVTVDFETDQRVIDDAIIQKHLDDINVVATDAGDGLWVLVNDEGSGTNPTETSTVTVTYDGKLLELNDDNELVESEQSFDAGTITQNLQGLIAGWRQGIPLFKTGGVGKLYIPSHLGYGTTGAGSIPPNAVLVFDIELVSHTYNRT